MKTSTLLLIGGGIWLWYRLKGPRDGAVTLDPNQVGGHTVRAGMGLTLPPAAPDAVLANQPMNASGGFVNSAFKYQPQSFGIQRTTDSPMWPAPINANPAQAGGTGPNVLSGTGIDPSVANRINLYP